MARGSALLAALALALVAVSPALAAPANDAFAAAQATAGPAGSVAGSNVGASKDPAEPSHAGNAGGASIWYAWTAPSSGAVSLDTAGSGFDTLLAVYTGSDLAALTLVTANDDVSQSDHTSRVSFTASAGTVYRIAVDGYRHSGGAVETGGSALTWVPDSPPPAGGGSLLLAAGDIASCQLRGDTATAQVLAGYPGAAIAALGDNAYPNGSKRNYRRCYGPTWGKFKARTHPAAGNHDYNTPGAAGYFGYFGAAAGDPATGYYSYDLGSWHVIVLNSNCNIVSCVAGSAQEQWLQDDLEAHPATCTIAYWHHPLFSSDSDHVAPEVRPFWLDLQAAHVELVLNGHAHLYERFAPQTADGAADPSGIREFIVGTGGAELHDFGPSVPNSEVVNNTTFGVLKLSLRETGYDWEFLPVAGRTFTDAGSGVCR